MSEFGEELFNQESNKLDSETTKSAFEKLFEAGELSRNERVAVSVLEGIDFYGDWLERHKSNSRHQSRKKEGVLERVLSSYLTGESHVAKSRLKKRGGFLGRLFR